MKTVLHSISYAGLWRNQAFLPLKDFIGRAAFLGYDGVEIVCKRPHAGVLEMTDAAVKEIRGTLKENKIECASMAAYTDFCSGFGNGLIPIVEMQLIYIREVIKIAHEWDCRLVRIFTGYENVNAPFFAQWNTCVEAIRECCKLAAPYGIKIGIQNHHDIALDAESLAVFIDEIACDNCVAMYDPWSPAVQGYDPVPGLDVIYPKMVYSTFADYKAILRSHYYPPMTNYEKDMPMMRACAMGDGLLSKTNDAFIKALLERGYDGYVAYELCSDLEGGGKLENLDHCAKKFLEFLKKAGV